MVLNNYYIKILAVDMGIQWFAWGISVAFQTEQFYDLTGEDLFSHLIFIKW